MNPSKKLNFILLGCGKMGSALLRAWLEQDLIARAYVIDPLPPAADFASDQRVHFGSTAPRHFDMPVDFLVLAIKPQNLEEACAPLAAILPPNTAILSILAGKSIASIARVFAGSHPIIRAMPNTPAAIGKGVSVAIQNSFVSKDQRAFADSLLRAAGTVQWIENESLMDAVTALSGSGPAYVFYLIEALTKAGESLGLPSETAQILARQTVIGSAALAEFEPLTPAQTLRENVTSKGGTTQAALAVLMDGRFQDILNDALTAARDRSRELNQ